MCKSRERIPLNDFSYRLKSPWGLKFENKQIKLGLLRSTIFFVPHGTADKLANFGGSITASQGRLEKNA
jgi:hypothetical protein